MFCLLVDFGGEKASIFHTWKEDPGIRHLAIYLLLCHYTLLLYSPYDSYVLFTTLLHSTTIYNNLLGVFDPQGKTV